MFETAPQEKPILLTRMGAQKYLPGSETSYRRWEKAGILKPIRLTGLKTKKYYRVEDLLALHHGGGQ